MLAYPETDLNWQCYHTSDIMRCSHCSLIFCGKCHRIPACNCLSQQEVSITACPNCGEMVLIYLSPGSQPINVFSEPTVYQLRPEV